jgi:hypothetical protein
VGVGHPRGFCGGRKGRGDHRGDGAASAQHGCGFVHPGHALLGEGAGFVLGVAGLQGGLLGQVQCFDRCGWSTMIMLELDGELAAAGVDVGPPGRPPLVQPWVDADNFADRPLARIGAGTRSEPYPQCVAEMLLQGGVVGLRCGNLCLEQHPAVDRQPPPVEDLDFVRHRDMGVQVRVAGPAVAVGERGRDQATHVDLPDPLRPGPGEQRPAAR